ncbi:MAG: Rieske 2Fe-2S domain-containing protein [Methanomassiliicoccales archaeon]|jgi:3-phenylpropionate/trans-cinnamate dioxygenase ferredoxin subunit
MFVDVAADGDLAEGGMVPVKAEGEEIVLCRHQGKVFAVSRRCGHEGAAMNVGALSGHIIVCPLHFAQFDIITGEALLGPANKSYGTDARSSRGKTLETKDLKRYDVKVEKGRILVDPSSANAPR